MLHDIRYAFRLILKNKTFAFGVIAALALGIGANSAIFTVVHAVLIEKLPFRNPGRLVWVWSVFPDSDEQPFSLPEFLDYRASNSSLEDLAAIATSSMNLAGTGDAERLQGLSVTANLFKLLGAEPLIGRTLVPQDDQPDAEPVVVLANGVWRRRFGSDPSTLGKKLTLNDRVYTVVGVMPPEFSLPFKEMDVIVPLSPATHKWRAARNSVNFLRFVGRLNEGVMPGQAQNELSGITARLKQQFPVPYATRVGVRVVGLQDRFVKDYRQNLWMLLGAMTLVLLIACGNLASLFLARASSRYREFAIRTALGASRSRVTRQLLVEIGLIAVFSGVIGIAVAIVGVRAFVAFGPADTPRLAEIRVDYRIIAFTALITLAATMIFGLIPTLQSSRANLVDTLREMGRGAGGPVRTRLRSVLVVAEVALAVALLSGTGLLIQSLREIQRVAPGFDANGVLAARLALPPAGYPDAVTLATFYNHLFDRLRAIPGVQSVGAASILPMSGPLATAEFTIEGQPTNSRAEVPNAMYRMVSPDYFDTVRMPLIRGRAFKETDNAGGLQVAVINRTLAEKFFPDSDPVGQAIRIDDNSVAPRAIQIVGVVGDVKHVSLESTSTLDVYVPMLQVNPDALTWLRNNQFWVVRTTLDPMSLAEGFRRELRAIDPNVPASRVAPLDDYVSSSLTQRKFNLRLLVVFALIAIALAGSGLYALISYWVGERHQEMAIRMALGAQRRSILSLVVGRGVILASIGLAAGLLASTALTGVVQAQLFHVQSGDPGIRFEVAVLLLAIAGLASLMPALRATRVNPAEAMRQN